MIVRCKYFTGSYERRCCGAGVSYESVKDQNRHDQPARYPCEANQDCFITCEKYEVDKELKKISRAVGRPVTLSTGQVSKRQDAILLAISRDGTGAFVEVKKKRRKYPVKQLVGIEIVRLTRKKKEPER